MSAERRAVGVLVSGAGTNLEALLRACERADFPARIVVVISNRRRAPALDIARRRQIPVMAMSQADFDGDAQLRDRAMVRHLREAGVALVVCAGYDRILSDEFLAAFPDAILNVHPSLLPAFAGGMDAVEQALAHGVKVTGCTVQLLEPGLPDGGPIVLQEPVAVRPDDDVDTLRMRIHEREWQLLPKAVELWCTGRLRREGRIVRIVQADSKRVASRGAARPALKEGPSRLRGCWGAEAVGNPKGPAGRGPRGDRTRLESL